MAILSRAPDNDTGTGMGIFSVAVAVRTAALALILAGLGIVDVVRLVLTLFMHCSCLERQCSRDIAPLTERAYERLPHCLPLFDAMRDLLVEYHRGKVDRERAQLISANDNPRDGLGGCNTYTDERFQEMLVEHYDTTWIVLPPGRVYACVDGLDTASIRQRTYRVARDPAGSAARSTPTAQ